MTAPAPAIRLTGIRKSIPPGYTLGRITAGIGDVQLIRHDDLAVKLAQTGQVLSPTTQQWQAGNVSALDSTELVINSTTITLANRGAGKLMGNPGTAAAKPSDITIGTGLTLSAAGTLSATSGGGTGTVTNVATGAGLSGGPITTTGTIVADWQGGTVVAVGSNLAITSGTIDVATTKLNPRQSVVAATAAALAANTYSNGTAGVGATLTGNANGTLTMDGVSSFSLSDAVLIKNEATAANNGVYLVTQIGDVSHPYILTRAPNFNTLTTINGTGNIPVINGTANAHTAWFATAGVGTIGTDPLTFSLVVPVVDGTSIVLSGGVLSGTGLGGVIRKTSQVTPTGTGADTSEDTLQTYTLPGGTLGVNGQAIRITAHGTFAANTHSKTLRLRFGGTSVGGISGVNSASITTWSMDTMIYRTGATAEAWKQLIFASGNAAITAADCFAARGTIAVTLASDAVISITGQITGTTSANDVVCEAMMVEFLP